MRTPRLWHIVPQFAPLDGVGDYALKLGEKLREFHGVESGYIVCWLPWRGPSEMSEFPVHQLGGHGAGELASLLARLQADQALLHYVGYGYQKRGVPLWLAGALKRWKRADAKADLLTLFHELWSKGPPISSVFYLSWLQRRLVAGMHQRSRRSFTSIPRYRAALDAIEPGRTELTQIPSNLDVTPCAGQRERLKPPFRALLFGQGWSRTPAVRRHRAFLEGLFAREMLEEVVVAGKDSRAGPDPSGDVALLRRFLPESLVKATGEIDSQSAGRVFAGADFFLCAYPATEACKSTAMKCAFAAGCPVVIADEAGCEPLVAGEHFLSCDGTSAGVDKWLADVKNGGLAQTGRNAMRWYDRNANWQAVANQFHRALAA